MAEIDNDKTEDVKFTCEKCGECCRHIEPFISVIPQQHDGICDFLHGDLCAIYENRPDLCDYKRAYKYFEKELTENEYTKMVIYFCKKLKENKR
jgi:Fe-S-cluster containining protein